MLRPFVYGKHLELNRHGQRLSEDLRHLRITRCRGVQSPVTGAVLKDEKRKQWSFGDVVVTAFTHGNPLVQIVAAKKGLPQLTDIPFPLQGNAKLLPD